MDVSTKAGKIRLLLMDVDGVLTDGRLYNVPGPDGQMAETKGFDSQDGIALMWLHKHGIAAGVISGACLAGHHRACQASQIQIRLSGSHREDPDL